jgi:hypothetical protein
MRLGLQLGIKVCKTKKQLVEEAFPRIWYAVYGM